MALARSPSSAAPDLPARQFARLPQPLRLYRGGQLEQVVVAYETWGRLNAARDNTVLLFTGLSPSAHAASSPADPRPGWWESMIGEGKPIDTRRWYVVCVNSLGSPFGSTSPVSIDPRTGRAYGIGFPELSVEDIAVAAHEMLLTLGIERVAAVVGPSLGGMTSLAWCALYPGEAERLVTISGAAHANPFAIALRSLQREMVRSDPAWRGGNYEPGRGPRLGLRLARKLGTITYRSAEEWQQHLRDEEVAVEPGDEGQEERDGQEQHADPGQPHVASGPRRVPHLVDPHGTIGQGCVRVGPRARCPAGWRAWRRARRRRRHHR